ncbi:hypothetical protein D4R75_06115 [bacterium]|nr:MAG: hypothetical protein D4R75_06115 [bacterium]
MVGTAPTDNVGAGGRFRSRAGFKQQNRMCSFGLSDLLRTRPKANQLVERVKMRSSTDEKIADEEKSNDNMSLLS